MGLELLVLFGAAGLGIWAVLSEPTRELQREWSEGRAQAAAKEVQAEIDRRIALLNLQVVDPMISEVQRLQARDEVEALELYRDQILAEELPTLGLPR